jgi:2,4-dienoyl-CoA reductase-like NADH-dependent reductase (Old Yellow Enzyme family)
MCGNRCRNSWRAPFGILDDNGFEALFIRRSPETYVHLAKALDEIGVANLHTGIGGPVPHELLNDIRASFADTIILCNGLTPESAEAAHHENFADLVAFSRAFIQLVSYF